MNGFSWNCHDSLDMVKKHLATFWARLFHVGLDCFVFVKLDAAEVGAPGEIFVVYNLNTVAPETLNLEYPAEFYICFEWGNVILKSIIYIISIINEIIIVQYNNTEDHKNCLFWFHMKWLLKNIISLLTPLFHHR